MDYSNIVKNKSISLLCHTALGDPTDSCGRYFEVGKEYNADIEIVKPGFDTKFNTLYADVSIFYISTFSTF